MFTNLFHRQSPASPGPSSTFNSRPTSPQPTHEHQTSRLVQKLKQLKKTLYPKPLNQKSWGNLGPGPFTARDYQVPKFVPISASDNTSRTVSVPTTPPISPWSDFAVLTSPTSAIEITTDASADLQQEVPPSPVEAEVILVKKRIAELQAIDDALRVEEARQLREAESVSPPPRRGVWKFAGPRPKKAHVVPPAKPEAKTRKRPFEVLNRWWGMSPQTKKKDERDEDRECSLKRGRAIRRRYPNYKLLCRISEAAEAPAPPVVGVNDEETSPQESPGQLQPLATSESIATPDQNALCNGATQEAGAVEDYADLDRVSSHRVEPDSVPKASRWFGRKFFKKNTLGRDPSPTQH
ncbi:hypothetical protein FRC01_014287 [Tulasnella sp. 417]|nr:hypothetical protein FRC01_014287 [Tulasnella sp. 417]